VSVTHTRKFRDSRPDNIYLFLEKSLFSV